MSDLIRREDVIEVFAEHFKGLHILFNPSPHEYIKKIADSIPSVEIGDPKPDEVRPIKDDVPKIGNKRLYKYMLMGGEIKKVEWVLDVKEGILYPREVEE